MEAQIKCYHNSSRDFSEIIRHKTLFQDGVYSGAVPISNDTGVAHRYRRRISTNFRHVIHIFSIISMHLHTIGLLYALYQLYSTSHPEIPEFYGYTLVQLMVFISVLGGFINIINLAVEYHPTLQSSYLPICFLNTFLIFCISIPLCNVSRNLPYLIRELVDENTLNRVIQNWIMNIVFWICCTFSAIVISCASMGHFIIYLFTS